MQSNPIFFVRELIYINIIVVNFLCLMTWLEDEQQELYISGYEAFLLDLKRRLRDLNLVIYLTIIPRARMGFESIAHNAEGFNI